MSILNIKIFKDSIRETLWPTRCALCDEHGCILCDHCMQKLNIIDSLKACKKCGEPYARVQCCSCTSITENKTDPNNKVKYYDLVQSFCILDKYSGRIIGLYKDSGDRGLSLVIAYFISNIIPLKILKLDNLYLSYIPSTKDAQIKRGFDHCKLIAQDLIKLINLELIESLIVKKTKDQRKLSRVQRQDNLENKFQINYNKIKVKNPNKSYIILIDDVYTTGSTLNSAALALKQYGFKKVFCFTFSRTF